MASPADEIPAAAQPDSASRRVVLIEDSDDLRAMLREMLVFCGHDVWVAASGREGIDLIERCRPDVALVDIGLPDMDGYEVARRLRSSPITDGLQLVAVTGRAEAVDRQQALEAGFNEHLAKPIDLARLATLLQLSSQP